MAYQVTRRGWRSGQRWLALVLIGIGALALPDSVALGGAGGLSGGLIRQADARSSAASPGASCAVFPADNVWRARVDTLPVDASSSLYVGSAGAGVGLHPDFGSNPSYGIPFTTVPGSQPTVPVSFTYASESDPGPYPIPANAPVEGGSDLHVLVVDRDRCKLYELFAGQQVAGGWQAGSGAVFDLTANALRPAGWTSADAAGLPILPGLVSYDEVASGVINHALRFTVANTRNQYVWPARHKASSSTNAAYPPMGERFRLKASFDISGFSAANQVILTALKQYGMFVADNGSNWFLSGAPDPRWNDSDLHNLQTLVHGANFEAVDESSLMLDPNSAQVRSAANPLPTLTALSPSSTVAGGGAFTLTLTGGGFVAGSVARWNGAARATTFVDASHLSAAILAADIASTGAVSVTVLNPAPGGGGSNALSLTVNAAGGPCTAVTLNASPTSPRISGTAVSFSAGASGCPAPLYQFWIQQPGAGWMIAQPSSTSSVFNWSTSALAAGDYQIAVWAKQSGSTAAFEWSAVTSYTLSPAANAPCTAVSESANPASPRAVGALVAVSALAGGCAAPLYQFWMLATGGAWSIAQPYSTSGTFSWNTAGLTGGTYQIAVWVKQTGSSATFEWSNQISYTLTGGAQVCNAVVETASPASPQPVGATVRVSAAASPCSPALYQFWLQGPGLAWTVVQAYSTSPNWDWSTTGYPAGTYQVAVWAKAQGSAATLEWSNALNFTLN